MGQENLRFLVGSAYGSPLDPAYFGSFCVPCGTIGFWPAEAYLAFGAGRNWIVLCKYDRSLSFTITQHGSRPISSCFRVPCGAHLSLFGC